MTTTLNVPELGESITSAFIAKWLKQVGESVQKGESMVELDSDKASLEVPSPAAGVVEELLVKEGDEVAIGAPIARIGEGAGAAASGNGKSADTEAAPGKKPTPSTAVAETKTPPSKKAAAPAPEKVPAPAAKKAAPAKPDHVAKAGPAVRQAAAQKGVDLSLVEGSGRRGQILEKDLDAGPLGRGPLGSVHDAPAPRVVGRTRRARADVSAAADDRAPARPGEPGSRDAHDLQRGRHVGREGAAREVPAAVPGALRHQARLHELLREGVDRGAEGLPRGQRGDRRRRSSSTSTTSTSASP